MKDEANKSFAEKMDEMLPDRLIHSVSFDHVGDVVEITFADLADQADGVGMIKTVPMERELFVVELAEIESDLRDLCDEALLAIRNKDAHAQRVAKAKARNEPRQEEEDDD